eukprot:8545254-Prorocentrum_lima.AAC.1
MLDPTLLEAWSEQLNNVSSPINTPPGEMVQSAPSVGNAGVDGLCSHLRQHYALHPAPGKDP